MDGCDGGAGSGQWMGAAQASITDAKIYSSITLTSSSACIYSSVRLCVGYAY